MSPNPHPCGVLLFILVGLSALFNSSASGIEANQSAWLSVDASQASARKMPETMFGISFEVSSVEKVCYCLVG